MDHFSLLERSCAVFEFFLEIWLKEKSNDLKKYCVPPIIILIFPYFADFLTLLKKNLFKVIIVDRTYSKVPIISTVRWAESAEQS